MKLFKMIKNNSGILFLLAIILVSGIYFLIKSKSIKEGALDMKSLSLVTESEKGIVLNEIISSINNHEKLISTYDKDYSVTETVSGSGIPKIQIEGAQSILTNLANVIPILNKHEISIQKLSMGLYYPNRTLANVNIESYKNDAQALQDFADIVIYHDTALKKIAEKMTQQIMTVTNLK